jgi:hypothetical protein
MSSEHELPRRWWLALVGACISVLGLGYLVTGQAWWLIFFLGLGLFYFLFEPTTSSTNKDTMQPVG